MNIIIIDHVDRDAIAGLLSDNVAYRPDLCRKSPSIILDALTRLKAGAIITRGALHALPLARWRPGATRDVVRIEIGPDGGETREETGEAGLAVTAIRAATAAEAYLRALEALERRDTERLAQAASVGAPSRSFERRDVAVIGAGLVNLVTAHRLLREGCDVRVIDAAPDPTRDAHWTAYGCSRGGDDARMFTLSEMDNYNDRSLSPTMNGAFDRGVAALGWGASRPGSLDPDEQAWISDYETLPIWLADRYNEDIFALSRESRSGWDEWIARDPALFEACEIREDILRLYSCPGQLAKAIERQDRIGAAIRTLSPAEVAAYQPALAAAVGGGAIAGGVVVVGFTINAHKLIAGLVSRMTAMGARFEWGARADGLLIDDDGMVEAVELGDRAVVASNYVISPGAYARGLLDGTRCEKRIHGVLGAWLRLPNLEPRLDRSLKLARRGHVTEDANITVATDADGQPILIIGSGYGHTGLDPANIDEGSLQAMHEGLIDTARRYFPEAYAMASADGSLRSSLKHCVRPWTASGLGLFETMPTTSGGRCVITGGHNTGGFAQSPVVAEAVLAALEGRDHAMHRLYHPDRASSFLERPQPMRRVDRGPALPRDLTSHLFRRASTAADPSGEAARPLLIS